MVVGGRQAKTLLVNQAATKPQVGAVVITSRGQAPFCTFTTTNEATGQTP